MFDITPIARAIIAAVFIIGGAYIIPYVKSKTSASDLARIGSMVKIAVSAAEQIYKGSGLGQKKKAYVLEWLQKRNITIDLEELDTMIESAVYELNAGALLIGEAITEETVEE